jgi:cytochrome d ubiquinol oxidase subunit II
MVELWYTIAALFLAGYAVFDGFDLGAGALHLLVARTDRERRTVLGAIGPFWDGNEVFLLAAGGVLFVAFPTALAVGLSGFYLAIFLVLWALLLRGVAIEFRSHVSDALWREFWDVVFSLASALLAVLFGAALANLLRGVPLDPTGWFSLTFFTHFRTEEPVGILDWYTVSVGLFALLTLMAHGGAYLAWKTAGVVEERSRRAAVVLFALVLVLWPLVTWGTRTASPAAFVAFGSRPLAWLGAAAAVAGILVAIVGLRTGRSLAGFLGSSAFILGILGATAAVTYPVLLRSVSDPARSITAPAVASPPTALRIALTWFSVGALLALSYFVTVFRLHRGKVPEPREGHGY